MIIYNVTVKVDLSIHDDWFAWMKAIHIPEVMATGFFTEKKFCRLLLQDESDGITYTIQYFCKNMSDLQKYQGAYAPALQAKVIDRYQDKTLAFRTLMETIE